MLKTPESKVLFIIIIVMAIAWIIQPESGALKQHKQDLKASNHRTDSINTLYIGAMKRINKLEIEKKEAHLETDQAKKERDIATRQKQIAQKKYENIKFINYSTNAKRDSVLSKLYPSYDSIR